MKAIVILVFFIASAYGALKISELPAEYWTVTSFTDDNCTQGAQITTIMPLNVCLPLSYLTNTSRKATFQDGELTVTWCSDTACSIDCSPIPTPHNTCYMTFGGAFSYVTINSLPNPGALVEGSTVLITRLNYSCDILPNNIHSISVTAPLCFTLNNVTSNSFCNSTSESVYQSQCNADCSECVYSYISPFATCMTQYPFIGASYCLLDQPSENPTPNSDPETSEANSLTLGLQNISLTLCTMLLYLMAMQC